MCCVMGYDEMVRAKRRKLLRGERMGLLKRRTKKKEGVVELVTQTTKPWTRDKNRSLRAKFEIAMDLIQERTRQERGIKWTPKYFQERQNHTYVYCR